MINFKKLYKEEKLKAQSVFGYKSYNKLAEVKLITISVSSAERIKQWAEKTLPNGKVIGKVMNANTLHYKTFKPVKGGLFCERIFGPLKDFQCACGKKPKKGDYLKKMLQTSSLSSKNKEIKNITKLLEHNNELYKKNPSIFAHLPKKYHFLGRMFCKDCEVEYTWSIIRRYQLGYIELISPVTHVWFLKGTPSYLSILFDMKKGYLEAINYSSQTLTIENSLFYSSSLKKPSMLFSSWQKVVTKLENSGNKSNTSLDFLKIKNQFSHLKKHYKLEKRLKITPLNIKLRSSQIVHFLVKNDFIKLENYNIKNLTKPIFIKFWVFLFKLLKKNPTFIFSEFSLGEQKLYSIIQNRINIKKSYCLKNLLRKAPIPFYILINIHFLSETNFLKYCIKMTTKKMFSMAYKKSLTKIHYYLLHINNRLNSSLFSKTKIHYFNNLLKNNNLYSINKKSFIFSLENKYEAKEVKLSFKSIKKISSLLYWIRLKYKRVMKKEYNLDSLTFLFYIKQFTTVKKSINQIKFYFCFIYIKKLITLMDPLINSLKSIFFITIYKNYIFYFFNNQGIQHSSKTSCYKHNLEFLQTSNITLKNIRQTFNKKQKQYFSKIKMYSGNELIMFPFLKKTVIIDKLDHQRKAEITGPNCPAKLGFLFNYNHYNNFNKLNSFSFFFSSRKSKIPTSMLTKEKENKNKCIHTLTTNHSKTNIYKNKLYNNIYCLSHRERWNHSNDWTYLNEFVGGLLLTKKEYLIPKYKHRFNLILNLQIYGTINNPINPNYIKNFKEKEKEKEKEKVYSSALFSGPGIINQLLKELDFYELKKMDKQNRILLYQLSKQIVTLKKVKKINLKNKSSFFLKLEVGLEKKELKECYKKRDSLIRRTKLVRKLFRKESSPEAITLNVLPVLPPDLRPIVKIGDQVAASDLNRLYQRIIYRNERLKKFLKDASISHSYEMKYAQRLLQEAVDNLIQNGKNGASSEKDSRGRALKSLSDLLKGKEGRFRQNLLGKRVDYSGRSVIVVGPKLKLHQCGIPKEMALQLYLPFLLKRILNTNLSKTVIGAKHLIKTNPSLTTDLLREIMQTHPLLLNRAPTLHRLSIQAFQPKLVEGRAILLHPLVCAAFNADFDGDQMAVHVPITIEARAEAWKLMLSINNILSPATGEPLAIPSQDMVLGCYYLTTNSNKNSINTKRGSGYFFNTFLDALKAYELAQIDLHAKIWVKWAGSGFIENGDDQEEPIEIQINKQGYWKEIYASSHNHYDANNVSINKYICTTPGKILFNYHILKLF
uniref:RNA polymerase beta' subunit n=1 Tax=Hyalomonas oviformis TaxID=40531 RepID=UPI00226C6470|nr:RNA polymerase beta' subunit [Hyalomonas oviformis]UZA61983.1 RNA polymerase beta' subunit [Hyalomonas oviformis]